jgi:hypothetical protein
MSAAAASRPAAPLVILITPWLLSRSCAYMMTCARTACGQAARQRASAGCSSA